MYFLFFNFSIEALVFERANSERQQLIGSFAVEWLIAYTSRLHRFQRMLKEKKKNSFFFSQMVLLSRCVEGLYICTWYMYQCYPVKKKCTHVENIYLYEASSPLLTAFGNEEITPYKNLFVVQDGVSWLCTRNWRKTTIIRKTYRRCVLSCARPFVIVGFAYVRIITFFFCLSCYRLRSPPWYIAVICTGVLT